MTSSPEETAAAAQKVLDKAKGESTVYDAISGHIGEGPRAEPPLVSRYREYPRWNQFRQLADQVEQGPAHLRLSQGTTARTAGPKSARSYTPS